MAQDQPSSPAPKSEAEDMCVMAKAPEEDLPQAPVDNPCSDECRVRSAVGNHLVNSGDAQKVMGLMEQINKDNVKTCRNACIAEFNHDDCLSCAKRALPLAKLEQDKQQLATFENCPASGPCTEVQQPVFNYNNRSPNPTEALALALSKKNCSDSCNRRFLFDGMLVDGGPNFERAKKLVYDMGMVWHRTCVKACAQSDKSCDDCAKEQISDADAASLRDQVAACDPCVEHDTNTAEDVLGAFGMSAIRLCTKIEFSGIKLEIKK
jgi:hypothetical protein